MSLTRLVMRLAAARALKDRTLAGARVFDSAVDPIDQTIAAQRLPLLVLTTDEHELDVTGRDLGSGTHRCDLVIELAIASRVVNGGVKLGHGAAQNWVTLGLRGTRVMSGGQSAALSM